MQICRQARIAAQAECPKPKWLAFFKTNCAALFQTALLLTADPDTAEASIAATLESVDTSGPPEEDELAYLHRAVVIQAIQRSEGQSALPINARSMIQAGLWPVLQLDRSPRTCFVLRTLLGYTISSCAQLLGIDEAGVRHLLRTAICQLSQIVLANNPGVV
jgi:hypothetical protein